MVSVQIRYVAPNFSASLVLMVANYFGKVEARVRFPQEAPIYMNREEIFSEVDKSNKRFDNYSEEERKKFFETIPSGWVGLSEIEKEEFVKQAFVEQAKRLFPDRQFFNLESDKNDVGGKFSDMSRQQVVDAATESAKQLQDWVNKV